jgi:hypothetical protein
MRKVRASIQMIRKTLNTSHSGTALGSQTRLSSGTGKVFKVQNGTIPQENKTPAREVAAVFLLLLGVPMIFGGAGMLWGWGGVLILAGVLFTALGISLGLSKTGKE